MNWYRRILRYPEVWVLTVLALITRLWSVGWPPAIVFDEVYFRSFAGNYLSGNFFFDIHPPLIKLIFAGIGSVFGLTADQVTTGDAGAAILRVLPALAGAALVPLIYLILRQLRFNRWIASLGALLILCENALLTESRFVLMDSMLLLAGFGALSVYLAIRRVSGLKRWVGIVLLAVLLGMLVTTKWTGLAMAGLITIAWAIEGVIGKRKWTRMLLEALVTITIIAAIYIGSFVLNFAFLTKSGEGDAFMSQKFQSTLVGNPNYDPSAKMSFWEKFGELNEEMYSAQSSLNGKTHPYGSRWYSWPLMARPVYYWQGETLANGAQGNIYLIGNPIVWLIGTVGLLTALLVWLAHPKWLGGRHRLVAFLLVGYALNFVPFAFINRPMFLYHYLFAYVLSIIAACVILAGISNQVVKRYGKTVAMQLYALLVIIVVLMFLYFLPLSYGWPLSPAELQNRMWLPTWR